MKLTVQPVHYFELCRQVATKFCSLSTDIKRKHSKESVFSNPELKGTQGSRGRNSHSLGPRFGAQNVLPDVSNMLHVPSLSASLKAGLPAQELLPATKEILATGACSSRGLHYFCSDSYCPRVHGYQVKLTASIIKC